MDRPNAEKRTRQVRVFVSSTFVDMIDDRNELADRAWPLLKVLCQAKGLDFVAVDLRWGINEEQSQRHEVLALLLAEIHECRPYFVGLVGERYGSLFEHPAFTPDVLAQEPWVDGYRDRSITELEILHAFLRNPSAARRTHFYFRDPKYAQARGGDFLSDTPNAARSQQNLKAQIEAACLAHRIVLCDPYRDPAALPQLVVADLTKSIEADFPANSLGGEADVEQEAFAFSRRRIFVPNAGNIEKLSDHTAASGGPLIVVGEPGVGKSALLSNWAHEWRVGHPKDFVFEHYVAGSPDSSIHWNIIRRLIRQIAGWIRDPDPLPRSDEELLLRLDGQLVRLRSEAERRGVRALLVLDGLDQVDESAHGDLLEWLPQAPFKGALRLIGSVRNTSRSGAEAYRRLAGRGWESFPLRPFDRDERAEFVVAYLNWFGKTLLPAQVDRLADLPAGANPLFLKLLLDELIVTGRYGNAMEGILARFESARSVPELLDRVLDRWEQAYERDCPELVGTALALIWSARRGLSEDELLYSLSEPGKAALPFAIWSPLRFAAWESLTNRRGVLNFAHDYLREAVERRYLSEADQAQTYRSKLADDFAGVDVTPRVCEELPWLLEKTAQTERLRRFLLQRRPFRLLCLSENGDLYRYWRSIDVPNGVGEAYEAAFSEWMRVERRPDPRLDGLDAFHLGKFLDEYGAKESAEMLVRKSLETLRQFSGEDAPEYAQVCRTLARLLKQARRFPEAATYLHQALSADERWFRADDSVIAQDLIACSRVLEVMQQYDQALQCAFRAAEIYRAKSDHRAYAGALVSVASIQMNARRLEAAEEALDQAFTAGGLRQFGPSESLAIALVYRGEIAASKKEYAAAARNFQESIDINRLLFGESDLSSLRQRNNLAAIYLEQGTPEKLELGVESLLECTELLERFSDESNPEFGIACSNLSAALSGAGRYAEALPYSERAVRILEPFHGQARGSLELASALNHYAFALLRRDRPKQAIKTWQRALRQMLIAYKIGDPSDQDVESLVMNAVRGIGSSGLSTEEVYDLVAGEFEQAQLLDIHFDVARRVRGEPDGLDVRSRVLKPVSVDLLPLDEFTEQQILRAELERQIDFHISRLEPRQVVPRPLLRAVRQIVKPWVDAIAYHELRMSDWTFSDQHFRFSQAGNPVFLLVSIFNLQEEEVKSFFVRHSNEEGFGYVLFLLRWLNNWPSRDLTMIFHLITCRRGDTRMYHTCIWDNALGANAPKEFAVFPVELLTDHERRSLNL